VCRALAILIETVSVICYVEMCECNKYNNCYLHEIRGRVQGRMRFSVLEYISMDEFVQVLIMGFCWRGRACVGSVW
jgi:hypothetical protein